MHPRGAEPGRHWNREANHAPSGGGLVSGVGGSTCRCGTRRGRVFSLPLPPAAFSFDSAPIPLPPFPDGEGGVFWFSYARGFAPCIPAPEPEAARAEPAEQVPDGGACLFGCSPTPPLACFSAPYPLPGGKGETKVISCKGLRPLHPWAGWGAALTLLVGNRFFRLQMERWHPLGRREPGL